jgi:MFS family permease
MAAMAGNSLGSSWFSTVRKFAVSSGALAERLHRSNLFLIGGFLIAGLAAVALPFANEPIIAFGVLAAAVGAPAGLVMALPAQALRPENRAGGMGVYFTWYYAGMAALPGLEGMAAILQQARPRQRFLHLG